MTTKNTNVDYYEKDWNDLVHELESSLEETYGLDLPEVETAEETLTEAEQKAEEAKEYPFTPKQLERVIKKAQLLDDKSIKQLYDWFRPLVLKAAHRYTIYTVLGEDAENIAWNVFYDFVYHYKGTKFKVLPGLLRRVVNLRLLDAAKARANYDPHIALDEYSLDNAIGMDEGYWDDKISDICLAYALTKLCKMQSNIIRLVYFENMFLKELVPLLHKPYHKIRYNHNMALYKLKQEYLKYKKNGDF